MPEGLVAPPGDMDSYVPRPHEITVLRAGQPVWRLYKRQPHATTWRTFRRQASSSRFDHQDPTPGTKAILYAADEWATCIAEVFQDQRLIHITEDEPHLACFTFNQDLQLLDLTGSWPTRAGASMAINSGNRALARSWSRAIHGAFRNIQGLRYASAMNQNKVSYAFYERAQPALQATPRFDKPLDHPDIPDPMSIARGLGYDLVR